MNEDLLELKRLKARRCLFFRAGRLSAVQKWPSSFRGQTLTTAQGDFCRQAVKNPEKGYGFGDIDPDLLDEEVVGGQVVGARVFSGLGQQFFTWAASNLMAW